MAADIALSAIEAGILIDAAAPWVPYQVDRWPAIGHPLWFFFARSKTVPPELIAAWRAWNRSQARAKRVQRAWRRLAALGLVRVGKAGSQTAIERTASGAALLSRRHNELHAIAERGKGKLLSDLTMIGARVAFWRDGGHTVVLPEALWVPRRPARHIAARVIGSAKSDRLATCREHRQHTQGNEWPESQLKLVDEAELEEGADRSHGR